MRGKGRKMVANLSENQPAVELHEHKSRKGWRRKRQIIDDSLFLRMD